MNNRFRLDDIDHQILEMLIENSRIPFTDIAKKLDVSPGTVHIRVKKLEEFEIITGSSLAIDYEKLGYTSVAYVGVFLCKTSQSRFVLERLREIPFVTEAHITTGKFNIFCKVRAKNMPHLKEIVFAINMLDGISRTETIISLEEGINDKKRLMRTVFKEL